MQAEIPVRKHVHELARNQYPVKIIQFGTGNFLRGFADWMVQEMNQKVGLDAGVCVVQSISNSNTIENQEGVFTVIVKGIRKKEFVSQQFKVDVIQRVVNPYHDFEAFLNEATNPDLRFIISNTTEAGVKFSSQDVTLEAVASTFPGKLTQLLFKRFQHKLDNSLLVLPTELIPQNGAELKSCILQYAELWSFPVEFSTWLNAHVTFCNTLVDRIVSGFPKKPKETVFAELGYIDELVVEAEWFHLWVIEGPRWIEEVLPFKKAGLNIIYTHDLKPYQLRKVRILNGAHTCMACVGYLAGLNTVREAIEHPIVGLYIKRIIYDDIMPQIPGDLPELEHFAEEVINRFRNPAIDHQLIAISLNSFSKFNARVLPSLLTQLDKSSLLSPRFAFAFASLIFFYRGLRGGEEIPLKDSEEIISFMHKLWEEGGYSKSGMESICRKVLAQQQWWGRDLTSIPHLIEMTGYYLYEIDQHGILDSLEEMP